MTVKSKIDKFIEKGGEVKADKVTNEWVKICLRIQQKMLNDIAIEAEKRPGIKRTVWILEAIQEKLNREKGA